MAGSRTAATKGALLDLFDQALEAGWPLRRACRVVELPQRRAHRWIARRARGQLADQPPGGSPVHRLLAEEAEQILALFDEWGELDRSHRKLAHRGSYLQRVWVSPSSVRRVLHLADKHFRALLQARQVGPQAVPGHGSSPPRTRSGSMTRPTSRAPGWLC